jgi:hypothetical protein
MSLLLMALIAHHVLVTLQHLTRSYNSISKTTTAISLWFGVRPGLL